jgi:hypothetical protein
LLGFRLLGCIPVLPYACCSCRFVQTHETSSPAKYNAYCYNNSFQWQYNILPHAVLIVVFARPVLLRRSLGAGIVRTLLMSIWSSTRLLFVKVPILSIASSYRIAFCWFCKIDLVIRYRLILSLAPHYQSWWKLLTSKPSTNSSINFLSKALATAS